MEKTGAAFGALFLLLTCTLSLHEPPSTGTHLWIARSYGKSQECGDGRPIFARLMENGNMSINRKEMALKTGEDNVEAQLATRAERVVFMSSERNVPFALFVQLAAKIDADVEAVNIVIVTPEVASQGWPCDAPEFGPR